MLTKSLTFNKLFNADCYTYFFNNNWTLQHLDHHESYKHETVATTLRTSFDLSIQITASLISLDIPWRKTKGLPLDNGLHQMTEHMRRKEYAWPRHNHQPVLAHFIWSEIMDSWCFNVTMAVKAQDWCWLTTQGNFTALGSRQMLYRASCTISCTGRRPPDKEWAM